ncbi:MAG: hypothetical protein AAFQ54_10450 [Pseudomonadota bacterium]
MVADPHPQNLDPYTSWRYGPGRAFDFFASARAARPHFLTGILERPDGHAPTAAPAPLTGAGKTVPLHAPTLWSGLGAPRFLPFMMSGETAQALDTASLEALFESADGAGVATAGGGFGPGSGITRVTAGAPIRQDTTTAAGSGAVNLSPDPAVDPSAPLVVLGIIDDGIPFAHAALADRVEAVWLQGMKADGSGTVRFGRELTRESIADLRSAHGADEDAAYRAAGALGGDDLRAQSALIGDAAHGAHTLGALASEGEVNSRIIAVDLPPDVTWNTFGHGKEAFIISALHYIFDRADRLAAAHGRDALPMVINLSYGFAGGGHDGEGIIEAALDELVEARRARAPTAVTMPSGNGYLDRGHAALAPGAAPLAWVLPPDDQTSTFLEAWWPAGVTPALRLHGPGPDHGDPGPVIAELSQVTYRETKEITWQGRVVGQLSAEETRSGSWRALVALAPTDAKGDAAPAGRWHVSLPASAGAPARLRIQRDLSYGRGYTGARQSYFDDPRNALFTRNGALAETDTAGAAVTREGAFNGMATGNTSLIVGGAKGWGSGAETYGGAAAATDAAQTDLSVEISHTLAEMGRLGLASRSGPRHRMTGTSMAAPAIGAALAATIAGAEPGEEASNYAATLARTGHLAPATPGEAPRLGSDTLDE